MKQRIIFFALTLLTINSLRLSAQGLTISGELDSSVSLQAGVGDAPVVSYGLEEYANIRFQSKIRDKAAVYGAVNFIAAARDYAVNAAALTAALAAADSPFNMTSYTGGENYIAAIELERLYFRINGEYADFDGGLMRIPFGYSQVWGSSDFLNPRNPLKPDARPRAVLGAGLFLYPLESVKMLLFGAAPRDAFSRSGNGIITGYSLDKHWEKASLQTLYSFETPAVGSVYGIHRVGVSVKADLEVGFVMDALYTINPETIPGNYGNSMSNKTAIDGLSVSLGADYSFFNGNLIVLAEYLYNGKTSSTAAGYGGDFSNNNYLYTSLTWRFNDYTNISAALISGFDDVSFTPLITLNHDLFQGAVLTITARVPLDRDVFYGNGKRGELGPIPPDNLQPFLPVTGERLGYYALITAGLKMRF